VQPRPQRADDSNPREVPLPEVPAGDPGGLGRTDEGGYDDEPRPSTFLEFVLVILVIVFACVAVAFLGANGFFIPAG